MLIQLSQVDRSVGVWKLSKCANLNYVIQLSQVEYFFFLCGQKEEPRKNREHAPPSNKWAFRCLAAELAASPLRQSSTETTPKSRSPTYQGDTNQGDRFLMMNL